MTGGAWARCDDLSTGRALEFGSPREVVLATAPHEVADVLRTVERATDDGAWAWGFVTYEAGRVLAGSAVDAFGPEPLVWFGIGDPPRVVPPVTPGAGGYEVGPWRPDVSAAAHAVAVGAIREHVAAGDVYQVNLTARWRAEVGGDLGSFYADLAARQRGAYNAFVDTGSLAVLSASPELFVERRGDEVVMRPMKGTAPRGRDVEEDARIVAALRRSGKDRAENVMIVDLVRNDLARIATTGSVEVRSLCAVERYGTVHQLTSEVSARVRPGVDLVDLFAAVFPSGSVTGAPKRRAMEIIDDVEGSPRGIYCGAVGFLAPPTEAVRARFNVAIRTVVVDRTAGTAVYGSGGGITWGSVAADEYEEMVTKTRVLASSPPEPLLLETMLVTDGKVPLLDRHLDRLTASASYLGYTCDPDDVSASVRRAALGWEAGRLRLLVERAGSSRVEVGPVPPSPGDPVRLAVDTAPVDRNSPWLRHKTTHREVYESRRARWPDVDDVVLVNAEGEVTETTVANILVRIDGSWFTPPLDSGCLPGVARGLLLDLGEIAERVVTVEDLLGAEAVEVVNALRWRRPAALGGDTVRSSANPIPNPTWRQ